MGYQNRSSHCDFTAKGVDPDGYYGSMVEYVYWNTGASTNEAYAAIVYANETATQTVGGYIGLMNASDYGYAYYDSSYELNLSDYYSTVVTTNDWLYSDGWTWTMTEYTSSIRCLYVVYSGRINSTNGCNGYAVRPVVYLKSAEVYIIDGDGSISNPYTLGIE